jgi:hypothetical protein
MTQQEHKRMMDKWADDLTRVGQRAPTGSLLDVDTAMRMLWSTYQGSKLGFAILLEMIDRWRSEHVGLSASDKTNLAVAALERWATSTYHRNEASVTVRGVDFGQKVIAQQAIVMGLARSPLKIKYDLEQVQQWPGQPAERQTWSSYLEVEERGPVMLVRVFAAYDTGRAANSSIKQSMKSVIEKYWNVATVSIGDGRKDRDLVFDLTWVDSDSSTPHQSILPKYTHNVPPKPLREMSTTELKAWRDGASEARGAGANVSTWDVDDRVEIVHEFGHMIGNPDEYYIKGFTNVSSPYRAEIYDHPGFTTDSIMNNTNNYEKNNGEGYGKIYLRHFDTVNRAIREYLKETGRDGVPVSIKL